MIALVYARQYGIAETFRLQHVLADGTVPDPDGVLILEEPDAVTAYTELQMLRFDPDGQGGCYVLYRVNLEHRLARFNAGGEAQWPGIYRLIEPCGSQPIYGIDMEPFGDRIDVVFSCGYYNASGPGTNASFTIDGVAITPLSGSGGSNIAQPHLVADGTGGVYGAWNVLQSGSDEFFIGRYAPWWPTFTPYSLQNTYDTHRIEVASENCDLFVMLDTEGYVPGSANGDMMLVTKLDSMGNRPWGTLMDTLALSEYDLDSPQLAPDGAGGTFCLWEQVVNDTSGMIMLQHISALGEKLLGPDGIALNNDSAGCLSPTVQRNSGSIDIIYTDQEYDRELIHQRIDLNGNMLCPGNGTVVNDNDLDLSGDPLSILNINAIESFNGGCTVKSADEVMIVLFTGDNFYQMKRIGPDCGLAVATPQNAPMTSAAPWFPMPARSGGTITRQGPPSGERSLALYGLDGRLLAMLRAELGRSGTTCVRLPALAPGLYTIAGSGSKAQRIEVCE